MAVAIVADDALVGFPLAARWPYLPVEVRNSLVSGVAAAVLILFLLLGAYVLYLSRNAHIVRPIQVVFAVLLTTASLVWPALSIGSAYELFVGGIRQGPFAAPITMLSAVTLPFVGVFALRVGTRGSHSESSE
ncbi:hypothetical protein [Microbacterium sp. RG1]|uniref:hypothetical protein n=1 Tax=Microbacterium sp. RG1 TaxID=2489212 RepID=UPI0010CA5F2E|nr:hypothetical protein [Microbacterium sp. RG1]QCQ16681.1 hypothetical protein EHF32_08085 [Microbacterium sp. RG1]